MAAAAEKAKSLTVFKSDRQEDIAACIMVALVTGFVLFYMAYMVPELKLKAPYDGKVLELKVKEGDEVKPGTVLYVLEYTKKKFVQGQMTETKVAEEIKSKAPGKVLKVAGKPEDKVKKGKETIVVLEHVPGYLP